MVVGFHGVVGDAAVPFAPGRLVDAVKEVRKGNGDPRQPTGTGEDPHPHRRVVVLNGRQESDGGIGHQFVVGGDQGVACGLVGLAGVGHPCADGPVEVVGRHLVLLPARRVHATCPAECERCVRHAFSGVGFGAVFGVVV